jgi:gliding motility-associated-like protein
MNYKKKLLLLIVSITNFYFTNLYSQNPNLLTNGDFQSGGSGTGFVVNRPYNFTPNTTTAMTPGQFTIATNPAGINTSFIAGVDHTGGGNMLIIDTVNQRDAPFWSLGNTGDGICMLAPGQTYTFSYWIKGISRNITMSNPNSKPDIRIRINNSAIPVSVYGDLMVNFSDDPVNPGTVWKQVISSFVAPASGCVTIDLINTNDAQGGNDFAIDDLELRLCTPPAAPTIGAITQPTCTVATGSFTITGYDVTNTYNFDPAVISISNTGLVIANPNTYTFTVTKAGCISPKSADIVILTPPVVPAAPTIGAITQPTCTVATGSFTITGYDATNTYNFDPAVISISNTGLVTANPNTYTFTVTNAAGCISPKSADIVILAPPVVPAAPTIGAITQPTCTVATGSFTITGYDATNTYNFDPAVISISNTGLVTANPNTYTFTVTNAAGCVSPKSADIVILAPPVVPAAPTIGAITQPTCTVATGSFTITGYDATNTYNFDPAVISISNTGLVTANPNTYTFTVTNAAGCVSPNSADIVILTPPVVPAAPTIGAITQPTCTVATGSFTITGYDATNTYNFDPAVISISNTGLVTANPNTYTFTVTNAAGCVSPNSADIVILAPPVVPATPTIGAITQPTCTVATGSFTIINYDPGNTYAFTPSQDVINTAGVVTAPAGTYSVIATSAAGCVSAPLSGIVINAQPSTPATPTIGAIIQPTCTVATGSFTITNYDPGNTYAFTPSQDVINTAGVVTAPAGTYSVIATSAAGCVSAPLSGIIINVQPATPVVPTIREEPLIFCRTQNATLENILLTLLPTASFQWYNAMTGGNTLPITTVLENGLTYYVSQTVNGCESPRIPALVTVNDPIAPDFEDYLEICAGDTPPILSNTSPNGIVGTWNPATINNTTDGVYVFTPDGINKSKPPVQCSTIHQLYVKVNQITLKNVECIVGEYFSGDRTITVIATDEGNYNYALDGEQPQSSNIFYNVAPGIHTITVTDMNGCSNTITKEVLIIDYPNYFTPNGDGFHDTWNISGLSDQPNAKISIFDRLGKLIKQISPSGNGWDGTFNGQPLPSTDYWFTVNYNDFNQSVAKTFKAHFALKR